MLGQNIHQLLRETGAGQMLSTAYDTAWIARLDDQMGERALGWLRSHQLPDGSWGTGELRYYHDRAICTLAAMIALAKRAETQDRFRLLRARTALETAMQGLKVDPAGKTIGFEMIMPTLLTEAEALGIAQYRDGGLLDRLTRQRAAKLLALPNGVVNRFVTVAFSAEMAGADGLQLLDVENLQEANGSVGHSPSATAYYVLQVRRHDPGALAYLQEVAVGDDGGVPNVAPFDVFERAWVLWNLSLADHLGSETLTLCQPHLDFLQRTWKSGHGAGFAAGYTPKDGDGTSIVCEVLTRFGHSVDWETVLRYEGDDHFHCYRIETNPSISVNIHILGALRRAGLGVKHSSVQKILQFLRRTQSLRLFWFDKWHTSPYYPTAHAIIACAGYDNDLLKNAIYWILETQNLNGSWGYYVPTAEETAYCLQALVSWKRHGGPVPGDVLRRGAAWLMDHMEPPYPPLWIGKCLYCPVRVVRSAVLSALTLVAQKG